MYQRINAFGCKNKICRKWNAPMGTIRRAILLWIKTSIKSRWDSLPKQQTQITNQPNSLPPIHNSAILIVSKIYEVLLSTWYITVRLVSHTDNDTDYITKHHPTQHHIAIQPKFILKCIKISKQDLARQADINLKLVPNFANIKSNTLQKLNPVTLCKGVLKTYVVTATWKTHRVTIFKLTTVWSNPQRI